MASLPCHVKTAIASQADLDVHAVYVLLSAIRSQLLPVSLIVIQGDIVPKNNEIDQPVCSSRLDLVPRRSKSALKLAKKPLVKFRVDAFAKFVLRSSPLYFFVGDAKLLDLAVSCVATCKAGLNPYTRDRRRESLGL